MDKIPFIKVFQASKNGDRIPFSLINDKVTFSGDLSVERNSPYVKLHGSLKGEILLVCDLSGEEFLKPLDEALDFYLSDGYVSLDSEHFDDVIECKNGMIDLQEILQSELEMIRCDYHTKEN